MLPTVFGRSVNVKKQADREEEGGRPKATKKGSGGRPVKGLPFSRQARWVAFIHKISLGSSDTWSFLLDSNPPHPHICMARGQTNYLSVASEKDSDPSGN